MYTVVRCASCKGCWGTKGRPRSCPHCGAATGDDTLIVSTVDNASELQREVALANTPEQLRKQLRDAMPKAIEVRDDPSAALLFSCIKMAAIDDIVELERLGGVLRGNGIIISAEDVAEEAEAQGLLLRQSEGSYLLLQ